jgi:hypothetical protein
MIQETPGITYKRLHDPKFPFRELTEDVTVPAMNRKHKQPIAVTAYAP